MSIEESQITKLAIMGGTFDPIHIGHLVTAEEVRHEFNIDEVLFVPTGHPPHKSNINMTTSEHRYLMTVLATAANANFKVSRLEIEREGVTYTIDTIKEIKKVYGRDVRLYFITGADAIHKILTWKESEELLQICDFVAVTRPGHNTEELLHQIEELKRTYQTSIHFLEVPALAISSSNIRDRIHNMKPIKYLVPQEVENYIKKYNLYEYKIYLTTEERERMCSYVASKMSPKRYAHTRGVIEMAIEFANVYKINCDEVFIAALFHDIAKELPLAEKENLCRQYKIELDDFEKRHLDLAHGKIGAAMLENEWKITKPSILDSIRYHTVGREEMCDLEKVIYLADMTEEGRSPYKGKEQIKSLALYDLNRAMYKALYSSYNYVTHLLGEEIHPITFKLLEHYKQYDL
ncbi:nicotinate-nucleotide adenylyltransferase [Cellulosilyticum sp. I15G10I2]|uniref:nicotinate-nucleotide adenylyltransferase n=1 Tax=Cellulosilyticum sp. I15G10I2 TaxID=1892843 RepID=UPI00085C80EC|nr:nicotinate-nucleotide adenylyltransferase [Cellulosilyticum sp. I15G10I2]